MSERDKIICELQLLTGIFTDDINYMMYKLLKDGKYKDYVEEDKDVVVSTDTVVEQNQITTFEELLNSFN